MSDRLRYFILVLDIIMEISTLCGYYPHFVEISTFPEYYPYFMEISTFCGYYPHFVRISTFRGYYLHLVYVSVFRGNIHVLWILSAFCPFYNSHFTHLVKVTRANVTPIQGLVLKMTKIPLQKRFLQWYSPDYG